MSDLLKLVVSAPGTRPYAQAFELPLLIGRSPQCDLTLASGTVSRRHARIAMRAGSCTVEDLGSDNGVFLNGARVAGRRLLEAGDLVRLGECTLEVAEVGEEVTAERPSIPLDPVESQLLADIAANDGASRLVYADWLEQRGALVRAEFLRLQEELHGPPMGGDFAAKGARLRELAERIDVQWRRVVARPAIEACEARFSLRCPKEWGSLAPTSRSAIRHCAACDKDVYYTLTVGEARRHAARGRCVALDLEAVRWAWDMEPPYGGNRCGACGVDLGRADHDKCPACGARIDADIVMGLLA